MERREGNKIDSLEHLAQHFSPSRPNQQSFPVIVIVFELSEEDTRFGGRRNALLGQVFSAVQPGVGGSHNAADKYGRIVATADAWLNGREYLDKKGVTPTTKAGIVLGELEYKNNYRKALLVRARWRKMLRQVFERVDFIALPTLQRMPPKLPFFGRSAVFEALVLDLQNTEAVNLAGNPAIAIPIPLDVKEGSLTSLQLVGPRLSEADLVNAARLFEQNQSASASR